MENNLNIIFIWVFVIYILIYFFVFSFLNKKVLKVEKKIIATFIAKVSKIPGIIEVMKPKVADITAFENITKLHTIAMIQKYETIYVLLEHNARIQSEFMFLMKLSAQIPELQKNWQFIYIREFVIKYEKYIKDNFNDYNNSVEKWNKFVFIKNCTIIGLILPGKMKELI